MTGIQVGAVLGGLVGVAFFALFAGYYFHNRRVALGARAAAREDAQTSTGDPASDDGTHGSATPTR